MTRVRDMEVARSVLWASVYTAAPESNKVSLLWEAHSGEPRVKAARTRVTISMDFFKLEHDKRSLRTEAYFRSSLRSLPPREPGGEDLTGKVKSTLLLWSHNLIHYFF